MEGGEGSIGVGGAGFWGSVLGLSGPSGKKHVKEGEAGRKGAKQSKEPGLLVAHPIQRLGVDESKVASVNHSSRLVLPDQPVELVDWESASSSRPSTSLALVGQPNLLEDPLPQYDTLAAYLLTVPPAPPRSIRDQRSRTPTHSLP